MTLGVARLRKFQPFSSPSGLCKCCDRIHLNDADLGILTCLAGGKTNNNIAAQLNISEQTVKNHLAVMMGLFEVGSRTELVLKTVKIGILSMDDVLPE